ncbi:MAG: tetratricopeptide repeat protein [Pseudomonadota bacterium]
MGLFVGLFVGLGVAGPAFAEDATGRSQVGEHLLAARAIQEWRFEDARAIMASIGSSKTSASRETRYLQADLAFLDGGYASALQILQGFESDSDPAAADLARELRRLVAATEELTRGFARREVDHFVISFAPGKDELLADLAGDALEKAFREIGADLGFYPPGKVRVEILPAASDLARVSTLTEREIEATGTIALCKYGKIVMVSPRATVFGYPWLDTLAHEYAHYVVARATHDRAPVWLQEGLAKLEETRWRSAPGAVGQSRTQAQLLAMALRKGRLVTFEQMHPSMARLPSQEAAAIAFAEVHVLASMLHAKVGYQGIRSLLAMLRDGRGARRALTEVVGASSWQETEAKWKKQLAAIAQGSNQDRTRLPVERVRFRKDSRRNSRQDDENVGLEQVTEEKALRYARLAGMLRARGRYASAALEYEKALAITGPENLLIAGKLSRTYLEMGQPDRAVSAVQRLIALGEEDSFPHATMGVALLRLRDYGNAEKHLAAAVRISPFDPAVRCGLAEVYSATGRADRATTEQTACNQLQGEPGSSVN